MRVNNQPMRTIWVSAYGKVAIIDQTALPHSLEIKEISTLDQMIVAIKTMQVRGAPLIGAAGAYGLVLALQQDSSNMAMQTAAEALCASRPTAVNLAWAVNRMVNLLMPVPQFDRARLSWSLAEEIADEDVGLNKAIGQHGASLIAALHAKKKSTINILTHCNAGWLATVDWGTALSPIYTAFDAGIPIHVWVDETRPRNQGAALTAWELKQHGVNHTIIADNAGGHLMQHGLVDMVIVGSDRVTRTGDVCNKIGTYLKALAAQDNRVPFYAAVPGPTIDWSMENGLTEIPIELRDEDEVHFIQGLNAMGEISSVRLTPLDCKASNPAFDVTPANLVTGIITEKGVFSPEQLKQYWEVSSHP